MKGFKAMLAVGLLVSLSGCTKQVEWRSVMVISCGSDQTDLMFPDGVFVRKEWERKAEFPDCQTAGRGTVWDLTVMEYPISGTVGFVSGRRLDFGRNQDASGESSHTEIMQPSDDVWTIVP